MRFLPTLGLLAGLGAFATAASEQADQVKILYRYEKEGERHGIAGFNANETLIGAGCQNTLNTGSFAEEHVSVSVDMEAEGNITVGSHVYKIHSNSTISGGPSCTRIYNKNMVEIDCLVSMDANFVAKEVPVKDAPSCFSEAYQPWDINNGTHILETWRAEDPPEMTTDLAVREFNELPSSELMVRDPNDPRCVIKKYTELVGDGSAHQVYMQRQLTTKIMCDAASACSAEISKSSGWTFQFQATAKLFEWLTGGFAVSKSWRESANYECGGKKGESVCVWYSDANTKMKVQNAINKCRKKPEKRDVLYLSSPNSFGKGSSYYCVVGTCRVKGANYWDENGRQGGP